MSEEEKTILVEGDEIDVNNQVCVSKVMEENSYLVPIEDQSSENFNNICITKISEEKCEGVCNKGCVSIINEEKLVVVADEIRENSDNNNKSDTSKTMLVSESDNTSDQNVNIECKQSGTDAADASDRCLNIYDENRDLNSNEIVTDGDEDSHSENVNDVPVNNNHNSEELSEITISKEGSSINEHSSPISNVDDDSNVSDVSDKSHSNRGKKKKVPILELVSYLIIIIIIIIINLLQIHVLRFF